MAKFKTITNHFLNGEVSPRSYARSDLQDYSESNVKQLNMITAPMGGAFKRSGSLYRIGDSALLASAIGKLSGLVKCIPFKFNNADKYLIIFNGVSVPVSIATSPATDYGVQVYYLSSSGLVACSVAETSFGSVPSTMAKLVRFRGFCDLTIGGNIDMDLIQYAQRGEVVVFTHPGHPPFIIQRTGTTTFKIIPFWASHRLSRKTSGTLSGNDVANNWPQGPTNTSNVTMNPEAATGTGVTISVSTNNYHGIGDTGTIIRVGGGYGVVTNTTSTTLTVDIIDAMTTGATTDWSLSAWKSGVTGALSNTYSDWPRAVAFFNNRLAFFGSNAFPLDVWASQVDNIGDFRPPTSPGNSSSFNITIAGTNSGSAINWALAEDGVVVGTESEEILCNFDEPYTAGGAYSKLQTAYGSEPSQARRVANASMFIQRGGLAVRELSFNFEDDNYRAQDISLLADHFYRKPVANLHTDILANYSEYFGQGSKFSQLATATTPVPLVWVRTKMGTLSAITRDRLSQALAWHEHELGGSLTVAGRTRAPEVLSICVLPSITGDWDELWMSVRRTINGASVIYIEQIMGEFIQNELYNDSDNLLDKAMMLDCAQFKKNVSAGTSFTGFDHLDGEEVSVIADGAYVGEFTVSAGTITLTDSATEIIAGYKFTGIVAPISPDAGSVIGSAFGTIKRVDELTLRLLRSYGTIKVGPSLTDLINVESLGDSLYTGDKIVKFDGTYEGFPAIYIVHEDPYPFSISGVAMRGLSYDS